MGWESGAIEDLGGSTPTPPTVTKTVTDAAQHKFDLTSAGEIYVDGVKDPNAKASDLILVDGIAYHQSYSAPDNWWWYDFTLKTWLMRIGKPVPTPIPPDPIPIPPDPIPIPEPSTVELLVNGAVKASGPIDQPLNYKLPSNKKPVNLTVRTK